MALIKADRVKESSTSTGASTFALAGAYTGFRSFSSVCSVGDTFYYVIDSDLGSEWETGLGTYSATNTLTRTTVHSSSNSNNIVTFSAGTKNVYISLTGNQLGTLSTLAGSETLTNKTINASNNTITNVSLTSGVTGTLPLANGGTGTTTAQLAINALAGAVTSGSYLRGNGTNVVMATIQAADVPTLNQNTTGTASGSVSGTASYLAKFTGTNVVGSSQIVDNGTSIGIGTSSPQSYTAIHCVISAAGKWPFFAQGSTGNFGAGFYIDGSNAGQMYVADGTGTYKAQISSSGASYVTNSFGVGTASPGAQLQVTSAAAATKGLIVRGASAQSANLLELQNSAGTVVASVDPSGIAVFGAQTGAQTSYTIRAWSTPANASNGQILTSLTGATGAGERFRMSIGNTSSYGFLQTYENAIGYTMSLALQPLGGNVGIGTTSPSDKLHVIGNVRAGNYTAGGGTYLALTGDLPGYASGTYPTLKSDGTIYLSANGKYSAYFGSGSNTFGINRFSDNLLTTLLHPGGTSYFTGGSVAFGATTAPAGQLYVAPQAAATKGLVVRGAAAQSANLQEWQSSAGTVLASVDSAGSISAGSISSNRFSQNRFNKISTSRSLPTTVGDYVELCNFTENGGKYTIVISCDQAGVGQVSKKYEFVCAYQTQQGVIPPSYVVWNSSSTTPTNDFHLEIVRLPSAYDGRIRIKRVVGTAAITLFVDVEYSGVGSLTEYSGTGTSSLTSYTNTYNYQMYAAPPPPSGNSYSGNSFSIYGGNAATTGSGGSILLQAGAFSTSGSNGKVIVRGLASNTANLQEWQNNAGTVLSAVKSDGSIQPASMADSAATNNSIYYSTTASKLVYKDAAGTVNNLY